MDNVELLLQSVLALACNDGSLVKRAKSIKQFIDRIDPNKLPMSTELTLENLKTELNDPHSENAYQIANMTVGLFSNVRADSVLHPERYQ